MPLGRVEYGVDGATLAFIGTTFRSVEALAAKKRFLRQQVAPYREWQGKPRRVPDPLRFTQVLFAGCVASREAPTIVQPATLVQWQREALRLFWC